MRTTTATRLALSVLPLALLLVLAGCAKLDERPDPSDSATSAGDMTAPDLADATTGDTAEDTDATDTSGPCASVANPCTEVGVLACVDDASVRCVSDANGCLVEIVEACPEGCDAPSGECTIVDPCAEVPPCTGNECVDLDTLKRCIVDANGCSTEEIVDCAAMDSSCEYGFPGTPGPEVFCTATCPMPAACDEPARQCANDGVLVSCTYDPSGCLIETIDNCTGGTSCRTEDGVTACLPTCVQDPRCDGATELSSSCRENMIETCSDVDDDGCLELIVTNCGGTSTCDETSGSPTCALAPEVTFGRNALFEGPTTFVALADGDAFPPTQGFQGTWMFVLAMRTRGTLSGFLDLHAEVTSPPPFGGPITLDMVRLQVADGGDGFLYLSDIFFDLGTFEPPAKGIPVTFSLRIEDELGTVVENSYDMVVGDPVMP